MAGRVQLSTLPQEGLLLILSSSWFHLGSADKIHNYIETLNKWRSCMGIEPAWEVASPSLTKHCTHIIIIEKITSMNIC
jgi:hypothetical protein